MDDVSTSDPGYSRSRYASADMAAFPGVQYDGLRPMAATEEGRTSLALILRVPTGAPFFRTGYW
ncbi:MAG: hypothetical protein A4E38_00008 [Methanoregulaceae archaeon PtaB.Bin108]|nr:MAG: hypothetical protein A4E38_00008 [Methanoregulaceae archaeon PtaB.Bin108]